MAVSTGGSSFIGAVSGYPICLRVFKANNSSAGVRTAPAGSYQPLNVMTRWLGRELLDMERQQELGIKQTTVYSVIPNHPTSESSTSYKTINTTSSLEPS